MTIVPSLSARRAWIEITGFSKVKVYVAVALRKESVDRNYYVCEFASAGRRRSPQGERG